MRPSCSLPAAALSVLGCLLLTRLCLGETAPVAEPDSTAATGSTVILPVLAFTPDTSLMFGGTLLRFFYLAETPGLRPSVFSPVLIHTLDRQTMIFLGTELNWGVGRHRFQGTVSYQLFPDQFYGIGRQAPKTAEDNYTPRTLGFHFEYDLRIRGPARAGLGFQLVAHRLEEIAPGGLMAGGTIPGAGDFSVAVPSLQVVWDSRDNTWSPGRGRYAAARFGLARPAMGSDFGYEETALDLRAYLPAGRKSLVALQTALTSLSGDVPYFMMPRLGGNEGLRGYPAGRYLDRTMVLVRGEWRSGEVWGRVGLTAFAGIGDVASRPADLSLSGRLWCAGMGLRVTLNRPEQVKLRIDFGAGNDSGGFYLSLGEAF